MPIKTETLKDQLFGFLNSHGYKPKMIDSNAKDVAVPEEAEIFQFTFIQGQTEYGQVTISFNDEGVMTVYYDDRVTNSPKFARDGLSWSDFVKQLNKFKLSHNVKMQTKNQDHLHYDMAKREHTRQKKLNESYRKINKRTSQFEGIPTVKMIIQHSRDLDESDQRFRSISKIFVENTEGEKFLVPSKKPGVGKIYAMHISKGGNPYDERGTHIADLVNDYEKLSGFKRAVKNKQFNESATALIDKGLEHYSSLKETLRGLMSNKGYTNYFDQYKPEIFEENSEPLDDLFTTNNIDFRIESVLPILARLKSNDKIVEESSEKFIDDLESWADSLVDLN